MAFVFSAIFEALFATPPRIRAVVEDQLPVPRSTSFAEYVVVPP